MAEDKMRIILEFLKRNGPSLPVHIAKETNLNTLFAGAFLSELYKEKELKISNMKVGSSPLYYLEGQEELLANFVQYLPPKEKEAHDLLKKYEILEDDSQTPPIRVALRNLKDFAVPYKLNTKIIWRYMTSDKPIEEKPERAQSLKTIQKPTQRAIHKPEITAEQLKEKAEKEIEKEIIGENDSFQKSLKENKEKITEEELNGEEDEKRLNEDKEENKEKNEEDTDIIDEEIEEPVKKTKSKKIMPALKPKKLTPKDKFLEQIKNYLRKKNVEIIEIEKHDKKQISARVKIKDQAYMLIAFNKKRFDESDLLKSYKKYADEEIPFYFLSKGELSKKTEELIRAAKQLKAIGIFDEQ